MLPKCLLLAPKRGGRHHKPVPISHLCAQWSKGEFSALWNRASSHHSSGPRLTPNHNSSAVQTAVSLAREGLLSKACQVLTSSGLAPNNDTTWNLLVSKHPKCIPQLLPQHLPRLLLASHRTLTSWPFCTLSRRIQHVAPLVFAYST